MKATYWVSTCDDTVFTEHGVSRIQWVSGNDLVLKTRLRSCEAVYYRAPAVFSKWTKKEY